jgi:hypothetical protein
MPAHNLKYIYENDQPVVYFYNASDIIAFLFFVVHNIYRFIYIGPGNG